MKQLQELAERVKVIIAQNAELKADVSGLTSENEALSAKVIELAQENAEFTVRIAALTQENAAISVKFDEVQTQAIQGLDAVTERDQLSSSINELLASIEALKPQEMSK
ncbi:MAG: hypothetical protein QG604_61 [Candidatus Dependentiae bacterium]|nr:hypothetical protein [Candidatus Dependentiae bacterium]